MCQARGQEGPSWLKAKGQAPDPLQWGILEMFWGPRGWMAPLVVVGVPEGSGPKWPLQSRSGGLEQGRCRGVSHPEELQER